MAVQRIMPYHESPDFEATRAFYTQVLGLDEGNFGGGYIGFGSGQAQVLFAPPGVQPALPDMGVDVDSREAVDAAGWMRTGDLATMDDQGYVNIVGRLKDMVIRGGENVYPREIEEFLYSHPKVQDVQVIGVPDQKYGEEICAWIKLREGQSATTDEIREFCKGQIAHYKIPRYIEFVAEFPMTITGKIQKFVMREQTIGNLGLKAQKTA